jgi:hypothetical protein
LGPIQTHNIFAHNIEIKRYCNKKGIFYPIFFFLCELKIFIFGQLFLLKLVWKYFKMLQQYFEEENIFVIKMSFYLNIVCKNIVCYGAKKDI